MNFFKNILQFISTVGKLSEILCRVIEWEELKKWYLNEGRKKFVCRRKGGKMLQWQSLFVMICVKFFFVGKLAHADSSDLFRHVGLFSTFFTN